MTVDDKNKTEDKPKDDEPVIAPGQSKELADKGIYQPYNEDPYNPVLFNPKETKEHKEYNKQRARFTSLPSEKSGTASQAR